VRRAFKYRKERGNISIKEVEGKISARTVAPHLDPEKKMPPYQRLDII